MNALRIGRAREEAKEAALAGLRRGEGLTADQGEALVAYWRAALRRVERSHEPGLAREALASLRAELGELEKRRAEALTHAREARARAEAAALAPLIATLDVLRHRLARHLATTRSASWSYVARRNTAFPTKHPLLGRDPKQDKPTQPAPEPRKRSPEDDEEEEDE